MPAASLYRYGAVVNHPQSKFTITALVFGNFITQLLQVNKIG
jgi:hypothetical protein